MHPTPTPPAQPGARKPFPSVASHSCPADHPALFPLPRFTSARQRGTPDSFTCPSRRSCGLCKPCQGGAPQPPLRHQRISEDAQLQPLRPKPVRPSTLPGKSRCHCQRWLIGGGLGTGRWNCGLGSATRRSVSPNWIPLLPCLAAQRDVLGPSGPQRSLLQTASLPSGVPISTSPES